MPALPSLPAFRSRNYRLYFAGQLISLIGTWIQQIAMTWLAYRLTESAAVLGLVSFASQIPILLFSSVAGVWNDRLDRRRLLMCTQAIALLQALGLFVLAANGLARAEWLIGLAFLLGCINAVDLPARQAFVAELVERKADLPNAIGLNSLLMNASRFVGPALAGALVAAFGETVCFLLNALSYGAVLLALAVMRVASRPAPPRRESALAAWRAGLAYARDHDEIRHALLLVAGIGFFITPYAVMMPLFAHETFSGGADTYGYLIASAGGGSLCAALWLAIRGGKQDTSATVPLAGIVAQASLGGALALIGFALMPIPWLAYPLLALLGFNVVLTVAGSNTLLSLWVSENYRGRVMALFSTAFLGLSPIGSLLVGTGVTVWGVRPVLTGCGLLMLLVAVRHIRRKKSTTT